MSTVANHGTMKSGSRLAPMFVGLMAVTAAAVIMQSAAGTHEWHRWEFLGLLIVGAISSRLKVSLPGLNGNMSVNLPFIFIALAQLSMTEALIVAGTVVFIQSIPKPPHKFVPVRVLFNLSTALVAAGLAWRGLRFGQALHLNSELHLVLGCAIHLLVSTITVAVIISLTESRSALRTWSEIVHLSFPYYLASTGLVSIAAGLGAHTSWPMLVGTTMVMFVTYRSYRLYFAAMAQHQEHDASNNAISSVRTAAAGA